MNSNATILLSTATKSRAKSVLYLWEVILKILLEKRGPDQVQCSTACNPSYWAVRELWFLKSICYKIQSQNKIFIYFFIQYKLYYINLMSLYLLLVYISLNFIILKKPNHFNTGIMWKIHICGFTQSKLIHTIQFSKI